MSKTVDEKVVSMQFDNRNFESNVQTSMSTLDKLKSKLNFKDASKGFESIDASARKIDMSPLSNGLETVRARFSALDVVAMTVLSNITNSAINTAKHLVSAFTIEPVKTGLNEYELKMNSVQTIMMSTGESVQTVNKYLDELNKYSDDTIYSFQDMTSNIGKFTNAGVKLEDAVAAIKGISNEAAVSGANANQASHAMYNFAQALSAGYVKLTDWKSIEIASMATMEFKQQLIDTAVEMGTLTRASDGMYNTGKTLISSTKFFNDSLQDQWMTSEVLIETLKKYANEETDIGAKAFEAATKVKTFSQMMDVLKETAQSGWAKTWELIFGNLEEAKALFTPLTMFFSNIIEKVDDFRNGIIEGALSSPFGQLAQKVANFTEATGEAVEKMEDYSDIVKRVINGEFGVGQERWDKLTEAGYNWAHVQNLVNEELGSSFRRVVELTDAQKEQTGTVQELSDAKLRQMGLNSQEIEIYKGKTKSVQEFTDAQLKEMGLTDEEVYQYRCLEAQSRAYGKSMQQLLEEEGANRSGRELLIESFKNLGSVLTSIGTSIGKAWKQIFPETVEEKAEKLHGLIVKLNEITTNFAATMNQNGEKADQVRRTFAGLFAALDLIRTFLGGAFSIAFKIVKAVLEAFNLDILDVTSAIGDAIVSFRDWVKENDIVSKAIQAIVPFIVDAAKAIYDFVVNCDALQTAYTTIKEFFTNSVGSIGEWIDGMKDAEDIPKYIIEGLVSGFSNGISDVIEAVLEIGASIVDTIKDYLGIHSPSTVFQEIGEFSIEGFIEGIKDGAGDIIEKIKEVFGDVVEYVKSLDLSKVFAVVASVGIFFLAKQFADGLNAIVSPFEGVGKVLTSASGFLDKFAKSISKSMKALSFALIGKGIKDIAIAIGILVASVVALTFVKEDRLWAAVGALGAIMGMLAGFTLLVGGITFAIAKFQSSTKLFGREVPKLNTNILGIAALLVSISITMLAMIAVCKLATNLDPSGMKNAALIATGLLIFVGVLTGLSKLAGDNINGVSKIIMKVSIAMLLLVGVCKLAEYLDPSGLKNAALIATGLLVFVAVLTVASILAGKNIDGVVKMVGKVSIAMLLLVGVCKLAEYLDPSGTGLKNAALIATGLLVFIGVLTAVSLLAGNNINGVVKMITSVSIAMLLLVGVCKLAKYLDWEGMAKAGVIALALGVFIGVLVNVTKDAGDNIGKVALTMITLSVAIGILAGICIVLSLMDTTALWNGVGVVVLLAVIMGGLIFVTKYAEDSVKNIVALTVAVAVMATAIGILSFIKPDALASATIALGSLMAIMAVMIYVTKDAQSCLGNIIALTVLVAALGTVVGILAQFEWQQTLAAAGAIGILLLSLTASMYILSNMKPVKPTVLASLAAMIIAVAALALIINALCKLQVDSLMGIVGPLALLAGTMAILAIGLNAMNGAIGGAAALLVAAAALAILAPVLQVLGSMSLVEIGVALLALAGVFVVFGVAGYALAPVTPIILALSAAIALFGIGCMSTGAGVLLLAEGLALLGQNGAAGVAVLTLAITELAILLPFIVQQIALAIVALVQTFAENTPIIIESVIAIGSGILEAVATLVPQFIETVTLIITSMLQAIIELTPLMVETGFTIIMSLLSGLADNMQSIVEEGIEIALGFINGISEKLPDIIQAGVDLILNFVNGLAQAIEDNTDDMIEAANRLINAMINAMLAVLANAPELFKSSGNTIMSSGLVQGIKDKIGDIKEKIKEGISNAKEAIADKISDFKSAGKDLIEGLINGIKDKATSLASSVTNAVSGAVDNFKTFLGIKSPSRLFKKFGHYVDEGFIIGVKDYASKVEKATVGVGKSAVEGMGDALSRVSDAFNADDAMVPTITPVVDLSGIRKRNIALDTSLDASLTTPVNSLSRLVTNAQSDINNSNNKVVSAINALREELSGYYDNDEKEVSLYVDSKKLASSIAKPMDRELNILAKRGAY